MTTPSPLPNKAVGGSILVLQQKVQTAKAVMQENVDAALLNCDRLETIELKTQELEQCAAVFHHDAQQLKNIIWWRAMRMKLAVGAFVLVVLGTLVTVAVLATTAGEKK